ncbi:Uncharacterized protein HSBGL_1574 [Halapricum desulfuricans]|uniref:Uncharacterized protein n=1 Tax=Halapricum desulfuricans TaxID=2841257 RepID=A0A897NI26_9EURY|nr:hypothetical protein [Halapricum desulfuricans]QSG11991.1 Uncharacterized protein HSBGL_1574 [Halapricum desulfuricans]
MSSREYTRRDLMQKGVAGAGFVTLGSLAGCGSIGGGNGNGNGNGSTAGDTVPAKAEAIVSMDVEAMLNDDDLRDVGDTVLEELQQFGQGEGNLPEDVDSAIEMAREEADLDPTGFRSGTLFMQVEGSGANEDYAGIVMETDWSEDDLIGFLESEGDSDLEESEYSGKTIYSGADTDEGGMAVLSDGRYVIGPTAVLEDVIDVVNGDADAIGSELTDLYDMTTEGHVQFATVVPEGSLEDMDTEEIEIESLDQIEYVSGSVYKTDSAYGVETNMWAGDAASQLKEDVEFAIDAATRLEDTSEALKSRLEDVRVESADQTVTVSYEEDIAQVKEAAQTYIEENIMGLLFLLAFSGGGTTL